MIKINLVPQEILAKEAQRQQSIQAAIIGVAVLCVFVAASAAHVFRAQRLEKHLAERQQELDRLKKIVETVEAREREAAAVRTRLNVITDLLKGRPLYPYFMKDLVATMPADVWFNTVTTTPGSGGNMLSVTMLANAGTSGSIALWMRNLQGSGTFSEPSIAGINVSGIPPAVVHSFNLTTTYKNSKF